MSFGIGCATPGFPGVYSKVMNPTIVDFIIDTVLTETSNTENITLLETFDEFCLVGGTQTPTLESPPPTQFPTFPQAWICNPVFFGVGDGCDCNCGAPDPDCEDADAELFGCDDTETCSEGVCVGSGSGVSGSSIFLAFLYLL